MDLNLHHLILAFLIALGGLMWKFYSIIIQNINDKFSIMEKNMGEIKEEIKEIKSDIRRLDSRVSEMDKQIAILHVVVENHYHIPAGMGKSMKNLLTKEE